MEIGIDTFAALPPEAKTTQDHMQAMEELLERIVLVDKVGLDVVGIGQHHRKEFLDSANHMILAGAATKTKRIKLTSAVTVLSTADPVQVFQNFATLDLLSKGRAEIVAGRGSFLDLFPLFGYEVSQYNELYEEKLDLLLKLRDQERITWKGKFRPPLHDQPVFPRPVQDKLPIWRGVGGTPESFARAGTQGLQLMVAIIGGETHRFGPLVDLYRRTWAESGFGIGREVVGVHSIGYIADTTEQAIKDFYPGLKRAMDNVGKERRWAPMTMDRFLAQNSPTGAYLVGDPDSVAEKIVRHSQALGGLSRFNFQMDVAGLSHDKYMKSIKLLGTEVAPRVKDALQELYH